MVHLMLYEFHFNLEKERERELPWWLSGEEFIYQCRGHRFDPCSGKIPHAAGQLSPCITTTEPVL